MATKASKERSARRRRQREREGAAPRGATPLTAEKLAAMVGIGVSDDQALALAGAAELPDADKRSLLQRAKSDELKPFRDGDTGAIAQSLARYLVVEICQMLEEVGTVPPSVRLQTVRALTDSLDRLGGSYSAITEFSYTIKATVSCKCGGVYRKCTSCGDVLP